MTWKPSCSAGNLKSSSGYKDHMVSLETKPLISSKIIKEAEETGLEDQVGMSWEVRRTVATMLRDIRGSKPRDQWAQDGKLGKAL